MLKNRKRLQWILILSLLILGFIGVNAVTRNGFLWQNLPEKKITGKSESFTPWVWKQIEVRAVGDFIPHGSVLKTALHHKNFYDTLNYNGFRHLLEPVRHLFKTGDINMINFESPSLPSRSIQSRSYVFNAPPSAIDALVETNFNLFILANNHMYDQGRDGLLETISYFEKRDIAYSGAARTKKEADCPLILTVDGVKIAVWSFAWFLNDEFNHPDSSWVSLFDEQDAINKVSRWKDSVDITMVTFHGGEEYNPKPLSTHITAFRKILDAGAVVIIGSHPHVPQPVETYETKDGRETVIFYSLGNFIANQSRKYRHPVSALEYGDTRDALVASFRLTLVDYGPLGKKWEVQNAGVIPCWIENNYNEVINSKNRKIKRSIQVVSVYDEMEAIDVGLDSLLRKMALQKTDSTDTLTIQKLIKKKRHFLNRLSRIKQIVGDQYVKRPD